MPDGVNGECADRDARWVPGVDAPEDERASTATDEELLSAVREGDMSACAVLYIRHYDAALRAAIAVGGPGVAQDLVSESFTKIISALLRGLGPERALRPYLFATIRNVYIDTVRRSAREAPTAEFDHFEDSEPDTSESVLERAMMVQVMAQLPQRWSEILWRTAVLGEPLAVVAVKMGLNPNAAAALNFRARTGLRRAYEEHLAAADAARASGA